jgi:adenosylhomocysteine nucleosidase
MTASLTQPLLFIASDRREAEPWVAHWDDCRSLTLPVHWARAGKWRGRDVIVIANGVGRHRAAAAIEAARTITNSFSGICSIGTGGALDPSLAIADVIVATEVADADLTWLAADPRGPAARSGKIDSALHIARSSEEKKKLNRSGAILIEMEAAGVARLAHELAVPFYCIRVVSDLANETFVTDFENFLMPDGTFNVPRLIMYSLAHPVNGLWELLRLQRRTSKAARQLGGYLASCKF